MINIDKDSLVKLVYTTQEKYDELETSEKLENILFFITDTKRIYKGEDAIANYIDIDTSLYNSQLENLSNTISALQDQLNDLSTNISLYKDKWVLTE